MVIYHELNKTKTVVIQISHADEVRETPDPCGLTVVVCDGIGEVPEDKSSQMGEDKDTNHIMAIITDSFEDSRTAIAVAKAESGINPRAKNYNCRYNGRSTFCREGDKKSAWSVDCGVYQINTIGRECPEYLMDPIENIRIAKKMHESRGWTPWIAYNNKSYQLFLK
jgi:hypothetical protein